MYNYVNIINQESGVTNLKELERPNEVESSVSVAAEGAPCPDNPAEPNPGRCGGNDVFTVQLAEYLTKIRQVFDIDAFLQQRLGNDEIVKYYEESEYGYRFFHSTEGSIHMALNFDGKFDRQGYLGQARIVQEHIDELRPKRVLELASGKGFNLLHLAEQNPRIEFVGVDLTPTHVAVSQKRARRADNIRFEQGDFQDLVFPSETFDLVFVVESLCHAIDMPLALAEVHRVLSPTGRFVVIDGFRKAGFDRLDEDLQTATRFVELSMALSHPFWEIDDWIQLAWHTGFEVVDVEDISHAILPNLLRFQRLAQRYFKHPLVGRLLKKILPPHLVKNAIAGLLMPLTVRAGAQGYYVATLRRV